MNGLMVDLFTSDVGLMSLAVIVGVVVIAVTLAVIIRRKMNETPQG